MITVSSSYARCVAVLPADLRDAARELPRHLGLTASDDWEQFVQHAPDRHLPLYAAEHPDDPSRLALPDRVVDRFCHAHHCAGFYGLLIDRVADRQVISDATLRALETALQDAWHDALTRAVGAPEPARAAIESSLRAWRLGVAQERANLAVGRLSARAYARVVRHKLRWVGATSRCLLGALGDRARLKTFRRAHDLMMLGFQCLDDAQDADEDARIHGYGVPDALGYPVGGLVRASSLVLERAARHARQGRFTQLARWLEEKTREVAALSVPGDPSQCAFAGMVIAQSFP